MVHEAHTEPLPPVESYPGDQEGRPNILHDGDLEVR